MSLRLPYLQVTADTWTMARALAGMLEIPMGQAFMLLCDLWGWGLSLGPKDEAPTGEFTGSYAVAALAGAVGWAGDKAALCDALAQLDVIEMTGEGLRVRGLDRYAEAWEKAKRAKERALAWRTNNRTPTEPVPNAQRTRTKRARTPGDVDVDVVKSLPPASPPPASDFALRPTPEAIRTAADRRSPDPTFRALTDAIAAGWAEKVGGKYQWTGGRDGDALKALRGAYSDAEIVRLWRIGIALPSKDFRSVANLGQLRAKWNDLAKEYPPPKPRPKPTSTADLLAAQEREAVAEINSKKAAQ